MWETAYTLFAISSERPSLC